MIMLDGLFIILKEFKVKNVIIGKQFEKCENYEKFMEIAKDKKLKIYVVEAGQKINIEKDIYFDILWPSSENIIKENSINNNSLICKMVYKEFSILFTGDIEKIAEEEILDKYKNNIKKLKSNIIKIPHHGSSTSSSIDFLNAVNPQIALIRCRRE